MSGGQYREQDWQLPDGHSKHQAASRANTSEVRRLWREATPVEYPSAYGSTYARYHPGRDVVLLARYGYVKTCIDLSDCSASEQEHVRSQATGGPQP